MEDPIFEARKLLAAAAAAPSLGLRTMYLAGARTAVEAARAEVANVGLLVEMQERELERCTRREQGVTAPSGRSPQ